MTTLPDYVAENLENGADAAAFLLGETAKDLRLWDARGDYAAAELQGAARDLTAALRDVSELLANLAGSYAQIARAADYADCEHDSAPYDAAAGANICSNCKQAV